MRVLVTGGVGLHRLAHRRRAAATPATSRASSTLVPSRRPPRRRRSGSQATCATPTRSPCALDGVDAVCHQAAMVGLGVDLGDIADYVSDNDLGTAVLLRELAGARFEGRVVLASSMVVYGEGAYCLRRARPRPAGPARAERARRRRLRAALPELRRAAARRQRRRGRADRPAQRLRRDEAAPGASRRRVRARDRRPRHVAALPQRLRPADAGRDTPTRASPRCSRQHWRAVARRASSRTAASGATSSTCAMSPARTCSR